VLFTPGRAGRPGATGRTTRVDDARDCPFCEGHEGLTPPEVDAFAEHERAPDTRGWTIRVVPNKYPALPGHEVVVHGSAHAVAIVDTAPGVLEQALLMWGRRRDVHRAAGSEVLLAGINEGAGAGASLPHSHSQLVPFAEAPPDQVRRAEAFAEGCPLCHLLGEADGRTVTEAEGLRALCPPWSRLPYELLVMPEQHAAEVGDREALARAVRTLAAKLRAVFGADLSWNAMLHEAPLTGGDWHWHLELTPRLTVWGLIELGAGVWVNVVDPLDAAATLRDA
jgi:UDPglucose--hexose-1-phosphate uridylyltransferase